MGKVKCIIAMFLFAFSFCESKSQNDEIIRTGLLRAQLTISPSKMFSDKQFYFYLHGNLEAYLSKTLSLSGEGYHYLGNLSSDNSEIQFNHSGFFGASYHFIKRNSDFYLGIQPGLVFVSLDESLTGVTQSITGVDPLFSAISGYNFFVNNFFHFFIQTRFVLGEHNYNMHKDLSEFRFSAGLGFNINAKGG